MRNEVEALNEIVDLEQRILNATGGGGGPFNPHSPGPIGDVTPSTVGATNLTATGLSTLGNWGIAGDILEDDNGAINALNVFLNGYSGTALDFGVVDNTPGTVAEISNTGSGAALTLSQGYLLIGSNDFYQVGAISLGGVATLARNTSTGAVTISSNAQGITLAPNNGIVIGAVKAGSFSGTGTATTTFVVTTGVTMPNNTYKVNVTPTSALSAAVFYVTSKSTTQFTVTYLAGLTGTVTFDWSIFP
jgi:hypothetical protein